MQFHACEKCQTFHSPSAPCAAPIPEPTDPWKHRSSGMRCDTFMWFVGKAPDKGVGTLGRCRRHAPTMSGYPTVFMSDWRGDHKVDENKVATR